MRLSQMKEAFEKETASLDEIFDKVYGARGLNEILAARAKIGIKMHMDYLIEKGEIEGLPDGSFKLL